MAILIGKNVPFAVSSIFSDPMGRYIIVVGQLYGVRLILAILMNSIFDNTQSQFSWRHKLCAL